MPKPYTYIITSTRNHCNTTPHRNSKWNHRSDDQHILLRFFLFCWPLHLPAAFSAKLTAKFTEQRKQIRITGCVQGILEIHWLCAKKHSKTGWPNDEQAISLTYKISTLNTKPKTNLLQNTIWLRKMWINKDMWLT